MSQADAAVHYTTHPHASSGNKHTRHHQRSNQQQWHLPGFIDSTLQDK